MNKDLSSSTFSSKVIFGLISTSITFLIIGLIFKFMFWPGAAFTIVLGLTIIALLLLGSSIKKIIKKQVFYKALYPILGAAKPKPKPAISSTKKGVTNIHHEGSNKSVVIK